MILSFMEDDVWYKASELVDVLGVRETRTKVLLRALVEDGLLVDNGVIKGRSIKNDEVERLIRMYCWDSVDDYFNELAETLGDRFRNIY